MANNIAIDLGQTRTSMSEIIDGKLVPVLLNGNDKYSYSEVAYNPHAEKYYFDQEARNHILDPDIKYYKNFKILLAEKNKKLLYANGYDIHSPQQICKVYLTHHLENYLTSHHLETIDKLYVGVPEVCYEGGVQIDYREKLVKLIESIHINDKQVVKEVYVTSEPVGDGAYYVVEHNLRYHRQFTGYVFVIDLGGGTIDITLLKVVDNAKNELSDIVVVKRCGLGENTNYQIGRAANAFYEEILRLGLANRTWQYQKDNQYYNALNLLEKEVIASKEDIEFIFEDTLSGRYDLESLKTIERIFTTVPYYQNEIKITFGMLAKAYFNIIYHDFEHLLDQMIDYMQQAGIAYNALVQEAIKIIVTGGFSNFILTKSQVEKKFNRISNDLRFATVPDPENAVANGLAYLANGFIRFKKTCPFDLGIGTKQNALGWAMKHDDPYEIDEPVYLQRYNKQHQLVDTKYAGSRIPYLYFNHTSFSNREIKGKPPTPELIEKLKLDRNYVYSFGFSLDKNELISLHKKTHRIEEKDGQKIYVPFKEEKIILTDLYGYFNDLVEIDE